MTIRVSASRAAFQRLPARKGGIEFERDFVETRPEPGDFPGRIAV